MRLDEERHMKTLISTTEKYRRNADRRRAARGYQSKRVDRAKKILGLQRAGLSLRQIAAVIGCGKSTVMGQLKSSRQVSDLVWVSGKRCYVLLREPVAPCFSDRKIESHPFLSVQSTVSDQV